MANICINVIIRYNGYYRLFKTYFIQQIYKKSLNVVVLRIQ